MNGLNSAGEIGGVRRQCCGTAICGCVAAAKLRLDCCWCCDILLKSLINCGTLLNVLS